MNKYKIEITKTYCIDVFAESQGDAENVALNKLDEFMLGGTEHYYQTGDTDIVAYDVTNTDDIFNPIK